MKILTKEINFVVAISDCYEASFVGLECKAVVFTREKIEAVDNQFDDELQVTFISFGIDYWEMYYKFIFKNYIII